MTRIDNDRLVKSIEALRKALAHKQSAAGYDELRALWVGLFTPPAADKLAPFIGALDSNARDRDYVERVNTAATAVAGQNIVLTRDQVDQFRDFFSRADFAAIRPYENQDNEDAALQVFYSNAFATGDYQALKSLQNALGNYYGSSQTGQQELLDLLNVLGPDVHWDDRHIFALYFGLVYDAGIKQISPYDTQGSVW